MSNENDIPESGMVPTDRPGILRDLESGACIRVKSSELYEYRLRRAAVEENQRKLAGINKVEEEVTELRAELAAMQSLVQKLLASKEA